MIMTKHQSAFTLVELSVVLVIVALIAGAVMGGQVLMTNYKIKSLITLIETVETATSMFVDKYNAVPGNFASASTVFGTTNCPASPCNGDGKGLVRYRASDNKNYEPYNFFKHLSLAGLIDGKYDGTNTPISQWKKVIMTARYVNGTALEGTFFRAGNMLEIGNPNAPYNLGQEYAFTSNEAYMLDVKMDDGIADTGNIYGISLSSGNGCPVYSSSGSAGYNLTKKTIDCFIVYWFRSI